MLEVVAETEKPLRPYEELLAEAPSDISQADKLAQLQAQQEAQQQLEAAQQRVRTACHTIALLLHACPSCCSLWMQRMCALALCFASKDRVRQGVCMPQHCVLHMIQLLYSLMPLCSQGG